MIVPAKSSFRGSGHVTTSSRPRGVAPPYGSYKSWETFLAYVKTDLDPLPDRLDSSVWRSTPFSGSTRSAIQGALLFLGLTDPQGKTDRRLETLARSSSDEAKRQLLAALFDENYGPLLEGIDLPRATRQQIQQAFRAAGSGSSTADKAISFFVSFASEAGIELHQNLFSRAQGTRTRRKTANNRKDSDEQGEKETESPKKEIVPENPAPVNENAVIHQDGIHPALLGVLEALPKDGQTWRNAEREKLKVAFGALLDLTYPTIDDTNSRML